MTTKCAYPTCTIQHEHDVSIHDLPNRRAKTFYILKRGDIVRNVLAFGDTAFTVIATDKTQGRIRVASESVAGARKGGWFSAPFNWRVERLDPLTDVDEPIAKIHTPFELPEVDIREEAETQAPPVPSIRKGDRVRIQVTVIVHDVDRESPGAMYRCEIPGREGLVWLPESSVKGGPESLGQPTAAEDEAYNFGVEEGANRVISAVVALIRREVTGDL